MSTGEPAIDRYIAGFPPDIAFILERLRETIHKAAPAPWRASNTTCRCSASARAISSISAPWKRHVGLYPIYPQAPTLETELAPLRASKDTVKLVYAKPIPYALVTKLVKARVKELKAGARA